MSQSRVLPKGQRSQAWQHPWGSSLPGSGEGQGLWAGAVWEAGLQAVARFALITSVGTLALCVHSKTSGKCKIFPMLLAASCVLVSWATQGHGLIWDPALFLALELPESPFAQNPQEPSTAPLSEASLPSG